MVHRDKSFEVLYKRYNPLVRSVSSIGLQHQRKEVYKKPNSNRFRSRKPPKNPRDIIISESKPKKVPSQNYHLDYRKPKYKQEVPKKEKHLAFFPKFVTKSEFALQKTGSGKSLVVNPSKVKITCRITQRKFINRKKSSAGSKFVLIGRKYKMITSNKQPLRYKMSKSSLEEIKSIRKPEESKSDVGYGSKKNLNENEWNVYGNNESRKPEEQKKNSDIYGNLLGPTPDEAILAGLQTVIEMCSIADRKPVKKSSIQEVNKQKIIDWVKSEYILLDEEIKTSTSNLSIENLSERKETLQEIEFLVRKKFELENRGTKLKIENENVCQSNSRQLSVYYATQPSTMSDLGLDSLENSSEILNAIRVSHSIQTTDLKISKSSNIFEVYSKPVVQKKNQLVQTVCVCDKTTQMMESLEEVKPSLSESIKSIPLETSRRSQHSILSSEASSISLVEIKSSLKFSCDKAFNCSHATKSTQFISDLPLVCSKSTQVSRTNCECEKSESLSESSSSSCSSVQSSEQIPKMRSQIVNYFTVYTNKKKPSTNSSNISIKSSSDPSSKIMSTFNKRTPSTNSSNTSIKSSSDPSSKVKSTSNKKTPSTNSSNTSIKSSSDPSSKVKSTSHLTMEAIKQPKEVIEKLSKAVMVKYTPIQLDTTSSTPQVSLKSISTSTTELKPKMISKNINFNPIQSSKSGQTVVESKPCLHVENFTPTMIEPILHIIPEIYFSEKSIQTFTYDNSSAKSSQTIPLPTVCSQSIQIPSKSQSTIDLISKHVQTHKVCYPCMRSTQTLVESVNTSMEAHSSTLMVQKSVQTKITFDQSCESSSDTTSTCVTTDETTSGTSLVEEESSSYDSSSKPTVDTCTFGCGKDITSTTTQCDSIPQRNAATDPFSVKIASCQTSLSHWKCISNDHASTTTTACYTQNVPAYQKRVIQMCNANTCPMLHEAMVNISAKKFQTDKRSNSLSRIQVCNPSTCPMLKSASVNICADSNYRENTEPNKTKTNRRIQMCSSRNCRMLQEAMVNITNLDSKRQIGDGCGYKVPKINYVKNKKESILKCSTKTGPVLQQVMVNICSIDNNPDLSKTIASKCPCYKEKLDETYITCRDLPIRPCVLRDDCACKYIVEAEVESQEDDDTEEEKVFEEEEQIIVVEEKIVVDNKKKVKYSDIIQELDNQKGVKEITEPEIYELEQNEKVPQEQGSSKAVAVDKDKNKGNSKSSKQRILQVSQTLKRAIHIRMPSPAHNLLSGAVWVKRK